jgi:stage V sporulation protein R
MELINQRTKKIMEECKMRSKDAGLVFDDESLEYIITNKDMIELSPKNMIPTLYDYWVNDVEVLKGKGLYKAYPTNPYETVINSRPAISFYNDNNPDWLNIMIFYHVLAHIDFFQNNRFFKHTWNDDFVGQALADKRLIASYRIEHGRWVDYVIEFARSIDNITSYYTLIKDEVKDNMSDKLRYYFEIFLQKEKGVTHAEIFNEVERYNKLKEKSGNVTERIFFAGIKNKYPELTTMYSTWQKKHATEDINDVLEYIRDNSPFLMKQENSWMKDILTIIRNSANYFAPQIRTKIINEGWASYWHDRLFRSDDRIKGHEVAYAEVNAKVTSLNRVGINPYAIGMRLVDYVRELNDKGKTSYTFQTLLSAEEREKYNKNTGLGDKALFKLRNNFSDFSLINTFIDQDFIDKHNLFVAGKRMRRDINMIEYYVKSRKANDYKNMILDSMYHPPVIKINKEKTKSEILYLDHKFEGKQLVFEYISDVMIGLEFLWGGEIKLETTEIYPAPSASTEIQFEYRRVVYSMVDKRLKRIEL